LGLAREVSANQESKVLRVSSLFKALEGANLPVKILLQRVVQRNSMNCKWWTGQDSNLHLQQNPPPRKLAAVPLTPPAPSVREYTTKGKPQSHLRLTPGHSCLWRASSNTRGWFVSLASSCAMTRQGRDDCGGMAWSLPSCIVSFSTVLKASSLTL
jgi:hypothetical protein